MEVAAAVEVEAGPEVGAQFEQVFLGLHGFGLGLVVAAGNQFLADVRGIADDGVKRGKNDGDSLLLAAQALGQVAEWFAGADFKEVAAGDAGVVFFVVNLAGGKVESGQVGGEERSEEHTSELQSLR